MKKLNLNSIVKVILSDYGKDVFYHKFDEVNKVIVKNGGNPIKPRLPKVDNNGYTEFQLWNFMNIYGKYMMLAAPEVLEHLNIYIEEEDLDEVTL